MLEIYRGLARKEKKERALWNLYVTCEWREEIMKEERPPWRLKKSNAQEVAVG